MSKERPEIEWIGGHFVMPQQVTGEGPAYHPSVVVWFDPSGPAILKGTTARPGEEQSALLRLLPKAIEAPEAGPPRRPTRVRVADERTARRIRERHGIAAVVGPTPELEDLQASFGEYSARHPAAAPTYLPQGASAELVASLFARARMLVELAPWRKVSDTDVFAVDVPDAGVRGAVLSLIGALDESRGFLLFPNAQVFDHFLDAAESGARAFDLGGEFLSLSFEPGGEVHAALRKEIAKHGWPVADARSYPVLERRNGRGQPLPINAKDVQIAESLVGALVAFTVQHGGELEDPKHVIQFESQSEVGLTATLTFPFEEEWADDLPGFDVPPQPAPRRASVGRNEPCPCGSGLKYKRCCLAKDEAAPPENDAGAPGADHQRLVLAILQFGQKRFPSFVPSSLKAFGVEAIEEELLPGFLPWSIYDFRVADGLPLAAHYLREQATSIAPQDRARIEAQLAEPLSVWTAAAVRPGEGMTLVNAFTGARVDVVERLGSQGVQVHDGLLARVVLEGGVGGLHGPYPMLLPPRQTAAVVAEMQARAGWRSLPVTREALLASPAAMELVRLWRAALDELTAAPMPDLRNTDGDPLVLVEDRYALPPGQSKATVMAALEDAGLDRDGDSFTLLKRKRGNAPLESVSAASIEVHETSITISANSRKRALAAKRKVSAALASDLVRLERTEREPSPELLAHTPLGVPGDGAPPPPEVQAAIRDFKAKHWRGWMDQPIPALGGKTPRQAAKSAKGRAALELLLQEAERHESREVPGVRADLSVVRAELGLT